MKKGSRTYYWGIFGVGVLIMWFTMPYWGDYPMVVDPGIDMRARGRLVEFLESKGYLDTTSRWVDFRKDLQTDFKLRWDRKVVIQSSEVGTYRVSTPKTNLIVKDDSVQGFMLLDEYGKK